MKSKRTRIKDAKALATKRLIANHKFEFISLLNEARSEEGLAPTRSPGVWIGCGTEGHDRECMCDIPERKYI